MKLRAPLALAAAVVAAACAGEAVAPTEPSVRAPSFTATAPPVPEDSVVGGYGSGPTGGIEYTEFEYEPETGTEYVVTPDTTATQKGLTPTTTQPR